MSEVIGLQRIYVADRGKLIERMGSWISFVCKTQLKFIETTGKKGPLLNAQFLKVKEVNQENVSILNKKISQKSFEIRWSFAKAYVNF